MSGELVYRAPGHVHYEDAPDACTESCIQPGDLVLWGIGAPFEPRYLADDVAELLDRAAGITEKTEQTCPLCGAPIEKHPGRVACDRYPTTNTPQR